MFSRCSSMDYSIKIFAGIREAIDQDCISLQLDPGVTARDIKDQLAKQYPQFADLIRISRLAVSQAFVDDQQELFLAEPVELALIPPVSGG